MNNHKGMVQIHWAFQIIRCSEWGVLFSLFRSFAFLYFLILETTAVWRD